MTEDYDRLIQLLERRHSCRSFAPDPVDEKTLQYLSDAFALAPQAGGKRELRCRFITDRDAMRNLAERGQEAFNAYCQNIASTFVREETMRYGENFFWFGEAPVLAAVSCRKAPTFLEKSIGHKASLNWGGELSAAMASFGLLLAAETLGLGACCLTGPLIVWHEMESLLDISRRDTLILLIALGHKRIQP
ncbi:MAG: nitroreductase family protein [Betaproteobacteria bacterium]|nr:nitroreductase family protein [Betaproteobacteria bacterium]